MISKKFPSFKSAGKEKEMAKAGRFHINLALYIRTLFCYNFKQ